MFNKIRRFTKKAKAVFAVSKKVGKSKVAFQLLAVTAVLFLVFYGLLSSLGSREDTPSTNNVSVEEVLSQETREPTVMETAPPTQENRVETPRLARGTSILITADETGSPAIYPLLGTRIEWGPVTSASYAVWYETVSGDTATVEYPKSDGHRELPYPLKHLIFISREVGPVSIRVQVM